MKKITTYLWEHRLAYFFAIASMIISVSLDMLSPQLTRHIVDDVIVHGSASATSAWHTSRRRWQMYFPIY